MEVSRHTTFTVKHFRITARFRRDIIVVVQKVCWMGPRLLFVRFVLYFLSKPVIGWGIDPGRENRSRHSYT